MSEFRYDFDPADHVTIGTIGEPGQRTFYFQAGRGIEYVAMICEKEQMRALGEGLLSLLDQINDAFEKPALELDDSYDFDLIEPLVPVWRVAQLGVGYDADSDRVVLILQEFVDEGEDAQAARFSISRALAYALAQHTLEVVVSGRPACPFCGELMDPNGHFCPRSNGHGKSYIQ